VTLIYFAASPFAKAMGDGGEKLGRGRPQLF